MSKLLEQKSETEQFEPTRSDSHHKSLIACSHRIFGLSFFLVSLCMSFGLCCCQKSGAAPGDARRKNARHRNEPAIFPKYLSGEPKQWQWVEVLR
jgi:hypothetical protein